MSSYACFFNSPSLGGAERSFSLQIRDLKRSAPHWEFRVYLPYISKLEETDELKNFLIGQGMRNTEIFYYRYHPYLFELGRTSRWSLFPYLYKLLIGLSLTMRNLSHLKLKNPDVWWVGGNKVGFVVFLLGILSGFQGRMLWHFRDYPYSKGFYRLFAFLFKIPHSFKLEALSNSYDVNLKVKESPFSYSSYNVLYNPVSQFKFQCRDKPPFNLGCASMLAPWKGVHSTVLFSLLYEEKLKKLGFKHFYVYGDQIYKTKGAHSHYKESLIKLVNKFDSDFVVFRGLKNPDEIFRELDIFIHSSLNPEPFGRVILEGFKSGTLVISTGLGGSGELMENNHDSLLFQPYDYEGLFQQIKKGSSDERFYLIQNAAQKAKVIEEKYHQQLKQVFGIDFVKSV